MNRLAIYCGSATPADPTFVERARWVCRALAERAIDVVCGGGDSGSDVVASALNSAE